MMYQLLTFKYQRSSLTSLLESECGTDFNLRLSWMKTLKEKKKEKPWNFGQKESLMPPCLGFSVAAEGLWVSHSNWRMSCPGAVLELSLTKPLSHLGVNEAFFPQNPAPQVYQRIPSPILL